MEFGRKKNWNARDSTWALITVAYKVRSYQLPQVSLGEFSQFIFMASTEGMMDLLMGQEIDLQTRCPHHRHIFTRVCGVFVSPFFTRRHPLWH